MLIALAFAHFSGKLLLKEQMIIPVKKTTLNNAGHIDAELIDFSEICQKKIQRNQLFFTDCFLAKFPPEIFLWNRPIFLRICPWKSFEIWLFTAKIPQNRTIIRWILTLLQRKSHEIGRFFCEFWLFSREIGRFFRKFAPENPAKFCFFFREISEALTRRKRSCTDNHLSLIDIWRCRRRG